MNIVATWVLSVIAVASIATPAVVAVVNNRHIENMKVLELKYEHDKQDAKIKSDIRNDRLDTLASFANAANNYVSMPSKPEYLAKANEAAPKLLLILNKSRSTTLLTLIDLLNSFGPYTDGDKYVNMQAKRNLFNKKLPDWASYIEQLPITSLPEVPKLNRRKMHFFSSANASNKDK